MVLLEKVPLVQFSKGTIPSGIVGSLDRHELSNYPEVHSHSRAYKFPCLVFLIVAKIGNKVISHIFLISSEIEHIFMSFKKFRGFRL